ncbi:Pimeloyl-CoA dehydrogenase small subunit [Georgfuchsia toluolica]|uniref:Pimeloyl-CoA dehydrogenase small subunit n=1 Tax=Georgfuchsia toluolica TaxID=424218 RepID=A0A916N9M9_9PROT|nr:acyl-CoA dehydrogenase [Georgfuchsia toluolica]CAG4884802.1 Pimeloyl-CoA dehydrogenase small subunit [Georgfuchsia toluolica]
MNFTLNEDQKRIVDSLERFIQNNYEYPKRRQILASELGFSRNHWQFFANMGLLGLPFAEEFGGLNLDFAYTALVMEWFGRGLIVEPFLSSVMLSGGLIKHAGTKAQRATCLAPLIEGRLLLAFAHEDSGSRFGKRSQKTRAQPQGNGFVVNGGKRLVIHGQSADRFVVSAAGAAGEQDSFLFLLDADQAGMQIDSYRTVDGQPACDLRLHNVTVPRDHVLAEGKAAQAALKNVLTEATAGLCAEAYGCMQVLFDMTLDYVQQRKQFGKTIGSFQVIQHHMVDCYMDLEQARSMALLASSSIASESPDRHQNVAAAKAFIAEAGLRMGHAAIQLHGAMGMTEELAVGGYHKRLLMIQTLLGDPNYQIDRLIDLENESSLNVKQAAELCLD